MRRPALTLVLALTAVAAAAPATPAAPCAATLADPSGRTWDVNGNSLVIDGDFNAYDTMGFAGVANNGTNADTVYTNPDANGCVREDGAREIVFPARANMDAQGVDLVRKVYVPATGPSFARWLDILTNPGATAKTVSVEWGGNYGHVTGVRDSADGDQAVAVGEAWASFIGDGDTGFATEAASFWDGPGGDGWDRPHNGLEGNVPGDDNEDAVRFMYDDVVVPPGGMAVFMHVEHQNETVVGANLFARRNGDGVEAFFAGMSPAELAALRNWVAPDADDDGVLDGDDNCAADANAAQTDLDGDGLGDACDADRDGDGLSNDAEARLGTDPAGADSDGDGAPAGSDLCPAAAGPDRGCPAPPAAPAPPPAGPGAQQPLARLHPGRLQLTVRRSRTRSRLTLRGAGRLLLPAGVAPQDGCAGGVMVVVRTARRVVTARLVEVRGDCTFAASFRLRRAGLRRRAVVVQAAFGGNARLHRSVTTALAAGRG